MRCLTRKPCRGVLSLLTAACIPSAPSSELARVDLSIPARTELVLEITLSRAGLAYVRDHHRIPSHVNADYPDNSGDSFDVTLVAGSREVDRAARVPRASNPVAGAARLPEHVRPGCNSACRQLRGAPGPPPPPRIRVLAKTPHVQGAVAQIPILCLTREPCRGALSLQTASCIELARVDLSIPARTELVLEITLSSAGLAYVRDHPRVPSSVVAAYLDHDSIVATDSFPATLITGSAAAQRNRRE